ncbi:hypothetical protein P9875_07905 [Janthinobacterium rivuli]|uniref:Uncharacterized protein n=1 Tax=Janthinobacterium rivuli TaxID=2751478 RepID=A0ABY8IAL9_9BURK|nr:hypothetical protein [Janthinobacterium rivuli]WFR81080.1 hypothetical protein P9875_07905 [Janthinobacterium rivuli]
MDLSLSLIDVLKMGIPAILSFTFGRYLSSITNREARLKDARQKLVELIRKITADSILYHSTVCDPKSAVKEAALLDHLLHQLRTDLQNLKVLLKIDSKEKYAVRELHDLFAAVTRYPFQPAERTDEIETHRLSQISRACEILVQKVNR